MPVPSDPADPSLYDFTLLDQQVAAVIGIGAEPMVVFSLGAKPADLNAYAVYVQNVAKHLTQGWDNGHNWTVKVFRFGNEPDGAFWTGTRQEFFDSYAAWANALKAVDPAFILDAPGFMQAHGTAGPDSLNTWITDFLAYCQNNSVPVDF
ncbi:MAG: hypothetical protein HY202_06155, partial [Nitrospirae bacterium]|nr:hypothetical protein [Nitrospirota bacterium]